MTNKLKFFSLIIFLGIINKQKTFICKNTIQQEEDLNNIINKDEENLTETADNTANLVISPLTIVFIATTSVFVIVSIVLGLLLYKKKKEYAVLALGQPTITFPGFTISC